MQCMWVAYCNNLYKKVVILSFVGSGLIKKMEQKWTSFVFFRPPRLLPISFQLFVSIRVKGFLKLD